MESSKCRMGRRTTHGTVTASPRRQTCYSPNPWPRSSRKEVRRLSSCTPAVSFSFLQFFRSTESKYCVFTMTHTCLKLMFNLSHPLLQSHKLGLPGDLRSRHQNGPQRERRRGRAHGEREDLRARVLNRPGRGAGPGYQRY